MPRHVRESGKPRARRDLGARIEPRLHGGSNDSGRAVSDGGRPAVSGAKAVVVAVLVGAGLTGAAVAQTPPATVQITLKDHRFTPTEIHLTSGRPTLLEVSNADPTPEEFEMPKLAIEKVMVGGGKATVRLPPLGPGRYIFTGEYHEATAKGTIIVDAPGAEPKQQ